MTDDDRAWWRWTLAAAAVATALRARYLALPLNADEGGALAAARAWDAGGRLYTDVFIDRPQGVVWAFQAWDRLGLDPTTVRALAVLAGIAAVLGVAAMARAVAGSWVAGALAAWIAATAGASPAIEGYSANGELLAAAWSVPAVALAATALAGPPGRRTWPALVGAGALSGLALSMKQSGYDGVAAIGLWLVLAAARGWRPKRRVAGELVALAAGLAAVVGAFAAHGATLGWSAYRYALYGFRLHARSAVAGMQWGRLGLTTLVAVPLLGVAAVLALRALRAAPTVRAQPGSRDDRIPRPPMARLADLWLATAAIAFLTGGNHHRHYWMGVVFPFAAWVGVALATDSRLAALACGKAPSTSPLRRVIAAVIALPLTISLVLVAAPGIERDPRIDGDVAIARWWRDHGGDAAHPLLPVCASAGFFAAADELPPYPYLWVDHVRYAHRAVDDLVAYLSGPDAPAFVARYQPPDRCDPSGRVGAVLARRYRAVAEVADVPVLALAGPST